MPISPYITEAHRRGLGLKPINPDKRDFAAAVAQTPALLDEARAELARLDLLAKAFGADFQKRDHEGYIRHRALSRMVAQVSG